MAKPRIFISSTYFDLKSVRADLEHFIKEQGYDPVLHERGSVPYGSRESLERYCYKEIENCDILVSIVGGRYGSPSSESSYSISQVELKVALELSKQVYVFVEREVYHEYRTYEKNKNNIVKWASVDNVKIYEFIEEIYGLKNNNPVMPFETSYDIMENLREQWSGLFQRLLAQQSLGVQASLFNDLKQSVETARSLVDVVSAAADRRDEVVAGLVLLSHPLFSDLKRLLKVPYRFVVETKDELDKWLTARGFKEDAFASFDDETEWVKIDNSRDLVENISISNEVFDAEGNLKPFTAQQWSDKFVSLKVTKRSKALSHPFADLDDDIPF